MFNLSFLLFSALQQPQSISTHPLFLSRLGKSEFDVLKSRLDFYIQNVVVFSLDFNTIDSPCCVVIAILDPEFTCGSTFELYFLSLVKVGLEF